MKARSALGGLALLLGLTLPVAAAPADSPELAQAPPDATRPAPGPETRPQWGHRPEGRFAAHHRRVRHARRHHFSLASLALRHERDLLLTPAQVESLRKLGTDSKREAIKRQADKRLAELDLRTLMLPDPADPNKPRDLPKIEAKVREIEKLSADGRIERIRSLEASRQVLTPEQREKLRSLLAERLHRGRGMPGPRPYEPGMRGMAPGAGGEQPVATPGEAPTEG